MALAGCGGPAVPDPRDAIARYGRAAAAGDADIVYSMLTAEAKAAYGRAGTRQRLSDAKGEIGAFARSAASPGASLHTRAVVEFVDGGQAVLDIEDGHFRISSAAGLPSAPSTPAAALSELRTALGRRSYAALIRLLSSDTRAALERDLGSLYRGLERPESLRIDTQGDTAEVGIPNGHRVLLRREAGVWRIHDFE